MKIIILLLSLSVSLIADPVIKLSPDEGKVKLSVSDLPLGNAVLILTSDDLNEWIVAVPKDEPTKLCLHFVPKDKIDKESVYWWVSTNKNKSFFKVLILNY